MALQTHDTKKRLAQLKKQVPTRGYEQYPWKVKQINDLPAELESKVVKDLAAQNDIQSIIAFPPQIHQGWDYIPKQALLFTATDVIHLQASIWPDQEPQITRVNGNGLMYLEVKLLLLYGFLEIIAQGPSAPARLRMEFNTVGWNHLSRPLHQLLLSSRKITTLTDSFTTQTEAYRSLENLPLKFSNGVRLYGLLPGEELEEMVFQRGTWDRWLILIRRPVTANILLALTTNFLVVIQEDVKISQGWVFSYIPRKSITGMKNKPIGSWNELAIHLEQGGQSAQVTLKLKSDTLDAWRTLWIGYNGQWQELASLVE
ncbi:MAG: hypothetical protein JXA42_02090 [Anaerolineales bacterium]|nr:hypothetical protein [Anaerolineales bacterium]